MLTSSTGKSEATMTYDAYGNTTGTTGTAKTPLGYDAQYTSTDTGLIYLRARTYDPQTAQFLSVDPLVGVTRAPYNYASNNPINAIDPSGLDTHGYCAGAGVTAGPFSGFASFCIVKSDTGEIGVELTGGVSGGITTNAIQGLVAAIERNPAGLLALVSGSVTGGYQSSNASNVCELGGQFSYTQGTLGFGLSVGYEGFSNGAGVSGQTYNVGRGTGASLTHGTSETTVIGFSSGSAVGQIANPLLDALNRSNPLWQLGL
jgi:RHS repeat-associated protein